MSVNILLYGLMGPFAAAVMQRLGVRRTTIIALSLPVVGVVGLAPLVRQPWQLGLLWGVVVGAGSGAAALVLGAVVEPPRSRASAEPKSSPKESTPRRGGKVAMLATRYRLSLLS